jgi:hypothetical protein
MTCTSTTGLRALASEDARVVPPAHMEAHVMRAWDAHQARARATRRSRHWSLLVWRFAALAVAVALSTMHMWWPSQTAETRPPTPPSGPGMFATDPFPERGGLTVMRVRMSRRAFANLGFPIVDPDAAGMVDVEVVVGEDGVARSIRRAARVEIPAIQE